VLVSTVPRTTLAMSAARARMGDPFEQALLTAPLSLDAQRSVMKMPAIGQVIGDGS
jgi:hypothetical protein